MTKTELLSELKQKYDSLLNQKMFVCFTTSQSELEDKLTARFGNLEDVCSLGGGVFVDIDTYIQLNELDRTKQDIEKSVYLENKELFIQSIVGQLDNLEHIYSLNDDKQDILDYLGLNRVFSVSDSYFLECFIEAEKRYYAAYDGEDY